MSDIDSLVQSASHELADRFSVTNLSSDAMTRFDTHLTSCQARTEETKSLVSQTQQGVEDTNTILNALKEKDQELQATFKKIDQLEAIINQVKETYNQVASNVDKMERTIAASTPFRLTQKSTPVQPYFPPPDSVTVFSTDKLFQSLEQQG